MDNFDPYNVLLAISTNISQRLMTAFVLQGHTYIQNVKCGHCVSWLKLFDV